MGATSSVCTAQQISIQCREVTGENISCVSKGQGEKLQLAVYNSSTLLSYWFCPRFCLGSGHVAAFGGSLLGQWVKRHRHGTSDSNVWRVTLATAPQMGVVPHNHSLCLLPLSSGCCCSPPVGQVQREADKDSEMKQTWREDLSAPCLSTLTSGESVTCNGR